MADKEVKFKISLDTLDAIAKGNELAGTIKSIGSEDNLSGLIESLEGIAPTIAVVATAFFGMKEALDLTLEAEKIESVEKQFEMLGKAAGVSTDTLKEGLIEAGKGLISETELLQSANKAMTALGSSSGRLPEILDLARKATAIFGGSLTENFNQITQAIEFGNQRALRHFGILVDGKKAVDDFAKSHHVAADELNAVGKQQAFLEAALTAGKKAYADADKNVGNVTVTLQQFKVAITEIGEILTVWIGDKLKPFVAAFVGGIKEIATGIKRDLEAAVGTGVEHVNANIENLETKLDELVTKKRELLKEEGDRGFFNKLLHGGKTREEDISEIDKDIADVQTKLKTFYAEQDKFKNKPAAAKGGGSAAAENKKASQEEILDAEKVATAKAAIEANKLKLTEARVQAEIALGGDSVKADQIFNEQKKILADQLATEKTQIEQKFKGHDDEIQKLEEQATANTKLKETELEAKAADQRIKILENYQKRAGSLAQGLTRNYELELAKQEKDQVNWGKVAEGVHQSFQSSAESAFSAAANAAAQEGASGTAVAEALKKAFLGSLGDKAIAEGSFKLASGLWPPNPVSLGSGAALIALGTSLKALAGGGGASVPAPSGGAGGGTITGEHAALIDQTTKAQDALTSATPNAPSIDQTAQTPQQRVVHVNIAGNYMETEQTRRQLMEMIRAESDATDFRYNRIGET